MELAHPCTSQGLDFGQCGLVVLLEKPNHMVDYLQAKCVRGGCRPCSSSSTAVAIVGQDAAAVE